MGTINPGREVSRESDNQSVPGAVPFTYNGFLSYSHAADGRLAPIFQRSLQRFARPFWRIRALNIFRDNTSLSATPELWPSIQKALGKSEYFIFLASPIASSVQWVLEEIDEWLRLHNQKAENFIILVTEGSIRWNREESDFDWSSTTALPKRLSKAFQYEPLYLDLSWVRAEKDITPLDPRFLDVVATVAATLQDKKKEDLIGEDVRQIRRTRLISGLALLLILFSALAAGLIYVRGQVSARAADVRRVEQIAAGITGFPERRVLVLLEALSRNRGALANESTLEQSLRVALDALYGSIPMRHAGLTEVQVSPDGSWLATGAEDGSIRLWSLNTPTPNPIPLLAHKKAIDQLAFSPDSRWLVSGCRDESWLANQNVDGTARLWKIGPAPSQSSVLSGDGQEAVQALFSPAGNLLVVRFANGVVKIWHFSADGIKGQPQTLLSADHPARTMAFSPNGAWFSTGQEDSTALVWRVGNDFGQIAPVILRGHDDKEVRTLTFSPDGTWLVTTSSDGNAPAISSRTARLWNLNMLSPNIEGIILPIRSTYQLVESVKFSPDSTWLAIQAGHPVLRLFRIGASSSSISDYSLSADGSDFTAVDFSPDGRLLAAASEAGTVAIWSFASPQSGAPIFSRPLGFAAPSPAIASNPIARDYSSKPQMMSTLYGHKGQIDDLSFTPNGRFLVSGGVDGTTRFWSLEAPNARPFVLTGAEGEISAIEIVKQNPMLLAVSPADRRVGFVGDESVRRYRLSAAFEPLRSETIAQQKSDNYSPETSRDGRWLIGPAAYQQVSLMDLTAANPLEQLIPGECNHPCISDDSRWVATHTGDATFLTNLTTMSTRQLFKIPDLPTSSTRARIEATVIDPSGKWNVAANAEGWAWLFPLDNSGRNHPRTFRPPTDVTLTNTLYPLEVKFDSTGTWLLVIVVRQDSNVAWVCGPLTSPQSQCQTLPANLGLIPNSGLFLKDQLVMSDANGSVFVWNLPLDLTKLAVKWQGAGANYPSVHDNLYASPGGRWLVTFSRDSAFLWSLIRLNAPAPRHELAHAEPNAINGFYAAWDKAEFSADGRWLALVRKRDPWRANDQVKGGPLRVVYLVDLSVATPEARLLPYNAESSGEQVRFSKDGRWLVTGGGDESSRIVDHTSMDLWDLSRRNPSEKPFKLAAHDTTVEDFAFSPDQKFLLSVGRDRAIIKWDLGTSDPSGNWVFLQSPRDVQFLGHTHLFGVRQSPFDPRGCDRGLAGRSTGPVHADRPMDIRYITAVRRGKKRYRPQPNAG